MRQWWRHRTLRFRLAVWYGLGGTLLIAGFSATLYFYVSSTVARPLDHELRQDLAEIRRRLVVGAGGDLLWDGAAVPAHAFWNPENPWFELWDEQGHLVRRLWPFTESRVEQLPIAPERGRDRISVYNVARDLRRIAVRESGGTCGVAVTDEGPGISAEHRVQLGTRFFRPDTGRGRSKGGLGLGLSLTKAYMRVLGGSLDYQPVEPHGSTFSLTLPKA